MDWNILRIREHREFLDKAVHWFHEKWDIPESAYRESMEDCIRSLAAVPQWYIVMEEDKIIAGVGVIENDFHDRKDLTPNVCAVYVEEEYRNRGIAGDMLRFVCGDMAGKGIDVLYLVTDHTAFYERYGWKFLCMVQGSDREMTRMYVHRQE